MTPNPNDSGNTPPTEGQPGPSVGQGGAPAELAEAISKALEPFAKRLEEVDSRSRALQGDKDRGVKKVEGDIQKLWAEIEEAKKKGLDADEFAYRKQVQALIDQQSQPPKTSQAAPDTSGIIAFAGSIASAAKIDTSDPEYVQIVAKNANNPSQLITDLTVLVQRRATQPTPTGAQAPAVTGVPPQQLSGSELVSAYKREMMAARGKKNELLAIREKYRSQGCPVDSVTFTV